MNKESTMPCVHPPTPPLYKENRFKNKKKRGGVGGVLPHRKIKIFQYAFFYSVKPLNLEEEKGTSLGREPVLEFRPSARFKSVINMVQDTEFSQG